MEGRLPQPAQGGRLTVMKICPSCYAVCVDQRWLFDEKVRAKGEKERSKKELCPGCDRVSKGRVDGVVHLKGNFLAHHKDEAKHLIRNVAERKLHKNIAARICHFEEKDDEIVIETTDKALAERLGKEFEKAYSGTLDIQWPQSDSFARVYWQRD